MVEKHKSGLTEKQINVQKSITPQELKTLRQVRAKLRLINLDIVSHPQIS